MARDGSVLFAHAIEPRRVLSSRSLGMNGAAVDAALPQALRGLAGTDAAMQSMLLKAARLAPREMPVLLQGETGSGKEYLARAIHAASARRGSFVAVNCAALPESLIESELFGYLAGTYTGGAARGRMGLIEAADGGTLFLDEIGDMPLAMQSRLLRVLAESEVTPLGARTGKRVDIRVISASHHDLSALVEQGRFRADLLYRLNAAVLTLPALRQRTDVEWLVQQVLLRRRKEDDVLGLSPEAWQALQAYDWPGNLRELDNALVLALALAEGSCIEVHDLPEALRGMRSTGFIGTTIPGRADGSCLGSRPCRPVAAMSAQRHGSLESAVPPCTGISNVRVWLIRPCRVKQGATPDAPPVPHMAQSHGPQRGYSPLKQAHCGLARCLLCTP